MSVTINGIRGASAYSGDLSGSFMSPAVVGIQNIPVSTTLPADGESLVYNAASGSYIPGAVAADTSNLLSSADAASTYETIANVSSSLALKANASVLSAYATTGSNTFVGNQTITGSNPLRLFGNAALSSATLSTYPLFVKNSGSAGIAFGGTGFARIDGINNSDTFGAALLLNGQSGGDVYLGNGNTQLVIGNTTTLNSTSKILVYATATTNNALDAVTGSIQVRNGNLNVTGSASITSDLTVGGNLTVNGTRTVVNTTDLTITDNVILIASGAVDASALNGAGIHFGRLPSEDARIIYDATNDEIEIYPAARSAEFRGTFIGDGSQLTGVSGGGGSTSVTLTAPSGSLSLYEVVVLSGSNLVKADKNYLATSKALGIVTAIADTNVSVTTAGEVEVLGASSMSPGDEAWVSTDGSVGQYSAIGSGKYGTQIGYVSQTTGKVILQIRRFGLLA